jgi:hypothetical protein
MGVEYRHFLIPANPSFIPSKGVIKRIDDLLEKWNLKAGHPKIYNLSKGSDAMIDASLDALDIGQGMGIVYPFIEGSIIGKIMGSSYYDDISDEERYFQSLTLVTGLDYRIHPGGNDLYLAVKKAPVESNVSIKPYWEHDEIIFTHGEAYHSTVTTTPPVVTITATDQNRLIGEQPFKGYWRTAFIFDCGKDLPKLGDELFKIPNMDFVKDVEQALGCEVVEIGEVY